MPLDATATLSQLRSLAGYIQDGSDTTVIISQDDVTGWWNVRAGRSSGMADTLAGAIRAAYDATSESRAFDSEKKT